jgi:hypothetical protein
MRMPGFTAEASLSSTMRSYESGLTSRAGRRHPTIAQSPAASRAGEVLPAWCAGVRCTKNREGYWECDCIDEVWQ